VGCESTGREGLRPKQGLRPPEHLTSNSDKKEKA